MQMAHIYLIVSVPTVETHSGENLRGQEGTVE
jgi:hypothetical protein